MKRLYLTPVMPEFGTAMSGSLNQPPDIKRKLATRDEEKQTMSNIPPHIRPQPLIKYSSSKWSRTINATPSPPASPVESEEMEKEDKEGVIARALASLPTYAQYKAKRLAEHLYKIAPAEEEFSNLLYDLTSKSIHLRTHTPGLLERVLEELERDPTLPANYYRNKIDRAERSKVKKGKSRIPRPIWM